MLLNVTSGPVGPIGTPWVGYVVEGPKGGELAYPILGASTIESMRRVATREGFAGILIGSPSVEWAQAD